MQPFQQIRDIFRVSRACHRQLGELYLRLHDTSERERVRLLLEYLSRHETHLDACLAQFEGHTSAAMLDTWIQYVPELEELAGLAEISLDPAMSIEQVVDLALRLDEALVGFYAQLRDQSDSAEVRDLFEGMLRLEQVDEITLRKQALEL